VTRVKICGVTTVADALACAELGADAVGLNFVPTSPRRVDEEAARAIVRAVGKAALVVGVVAGLSVERMRALRQSTGIECLQLHGPESREHVAALLPHAYAAIGVAGPDDVASAESMPGDYVMVDARVDGALGGTGRTFDWSLVVSLARRRRLVLAGGLTPTNVAAAVTAVRPWCVDVASGVETAPGVKDIAKVKEFIVAAQAVGG
jgi:phosphoribosylanthranilate isomerase